MSLSLKNPHSVLAVLASRAHDVLEVRLPPHRPSDAWGQVAEQARAASIPVRTEMAAPTVNRPSKFDKHERTSAASATVRERMELPVEQQWTNLEPPFGVWLALDCLQDPHNVGAIFRSAAFFGIRGVVLTKDRSAPLTGTVYDVASGGMESVPFAQVSNLASTLKAAKAAGLWILGSSEHAPRDVQEIPRDRPWLVVIGNEEQGLRRLTLDLCDDVCRITPQGEVGSLNASVAAGVMMALLTRR
jgi:23S rRNA (guanosine2251-2'-O)-methyltransferase